ncbi:hypothetical protein CEG14_16730 [Bordetella genomosp. 1]|uniref:OmpR/PhoB-type domain-containing protein n=1 Tax=Bordetella genomosp. 1 TaxID=1395607 RepID=A0A261SGQ4_9BORD|nr:helix-turn-helix domain-containing protein [Bordetella genomosp. 1]OZI36618.1 hypothetical protein CEG14_16730 [Bordetella genomosp. 1]
MRYHDLVFEPDWLAAHSDDGALIRFTRKERALLQRLAERAPHLLTRAALADALAQDGGEASERNVDFVVNRLRNKLRDSARTPRFIATQYGEGYYWIAAAATSPALDARPLLVVGPNHGGNADLPRRLSAHLQAESRGHAGIACLNGGASPASCEALLDQARYTLETSSHQDTAQPREHLALVLRHRPSRQIVRTFRSTLALPRAADALDGLAREVLHAMWQHGALDQAHATPTERPLDLRMHETALMLTDSAETWRANEARIAQERAARPDDPRLAVMQALALMSRMILAGGTEPGTDWGQQEETIETLVLAALPRVQDDPMMVLAVARALCFVGRGHAALAERLAQDTFERSAAFAAAFATLAPMRMHAGRIDEAVALYDQGIALSEPGSEFRVSLMVMKCIALLASGERARLEAASAQLYQTKPLTRLQIGLFLAPAAPSALAPDLQAVLGTLDADQASRLMHYAHTVYARHFVMPEHRRNVLIGAYSHFERHFGKAVAPDAVIAALGR